MPENPPSQEDRSTELEEITPDRKTTELLKIPLMLEHTYLKEKIPDIEKIYAIKQHPNNYILTDSLGDRYFIGLELSQKERDFTHRHEDEYNKYNFLTFINPDDPSIIREIYRLNLEIKDGEDVIEEEIEISYSREVTQSEK
jgi:hypothetical protein